VIEGKERMTNTSKRNDKGKETEGDIEKEKRTEKKGE
jgi:hypothetical protein